MLCRLYREGLISDDEIGRSLLRIRMLRTRFHTLILAMQSNLQTQSQTQSPISLETKLVVNPTVSPSLAPPINPSARLAIVSLPPETFQLVPHVQPQRFISGWIWTLFVGSLVSVLGAVVFTSLTRTGSIPEWSVPNVLRQGEVNRV